MPVLSELFVSCSPCIDAWLMQDKRCGELANAREDTTEAENVVIA